MNAIDIVYSQYWLQLEAALMFPLHLHILKSHYCCQKLIEPNAKSHVGLLDEVLFE
jgi:hypothetical protein